MSNLTTDSFLEAIASYVPPAPIVVEHRIYYDSATRECTYKTIYDDKGSYIVVTREEYDAIEFCPNYYIAKDGKIVKKRFDFVTYKLLKLEKDGEFHTMKGCNIFRVDSSYTGATDTWSIKDFDEQ
jgi:hypothetical protein